MPSTTVAIKFYLCFFFIKDERIQTLPTTETKKKKKKKIVIELITFIIGSWNAGRANLGVFWWFREYETKFFLKKKIW